MFPLARKSWEFPGAGWLGSGSYRQNRIRTRISWILSIGTGEHLGITSILICTASFHGSLSKSFAATANAVVGCKSLEPGNQASSRPTISRDPATFLALPCCHSRWSWDMAIQKVWMQHAAGHGRAIGFRHTHFMALWIKHPISKYHEIPYCILMIPQWILPNQIPFYSIPLHPVTSHYNNIQSPNVSSHPSDV